MRVRSPIWKRSWVACEVGLQHLHVVLVELDDRAVADHVHVGGDGLGEDVAFDRAQRRPSGFDPGLRGADRIADRAAVEQRVAERRLRR